MSSAFARDGRGDHWLLVRALAKKRALLLYRYPMNTLSGLAMTFAFFTMIFVGGRAVSRAALTDSLAGIVVGYFLWSMATTAFSSVAWSITSESQWGTLEQLSMSPFGFGRVMLAHGGVRVLESFGWGAATLAFMLVLSGASLHLNVLTVGVLATLAIMPALGVGFVFGGLALLYKRIENAFQVFEFVLLGLIAAPGLGVFWARLLPISQGSYLLVKAMRNGVRLWEFPATELALLVASAVAYFALGYAVFAWASRRAREQGLMGHY